MKKEVSLILLKNGEQLISEIDSHNNNEYCKLYNPYLVSTSKNSEEILLLEEGVDSFEDNNISINMTLSRWIQLSNENVYSVPLNEILVITIPIKELHDLYLEVLNGK